MDSWYDKDLPAFVSVNGLRRSPPMSASISCPGCGSLPSGSSVWKEPVCGANADILDWAEKALRMNSKRIALEYLFEAAVKTSKCQDDMLRLVNDVTGEVQEVEVGKMFQASDATYLSWSFLYALARAAKRFDVTPVASVRGGFSASPAALIAVFKQYDLSVTHPKKMLVRKIVQAQEVANRLIKSLYAYNSVTDKYDAQAAGHIGHAFPQMDKNFIQSFKKAWLDGLLVAKHMQNHKKGKAETAGELWKVQTPPSFKTRRDETDRKRANEQLLNPVVINEKNFRAMVSDMIAVVFEGVKHWDTIEIPYIENEKTEGLKNRDRFNTALCLLQLGIGSRSRGIIAVNQIEQFDLPVLGGNGVLKALEHHNALRVKFLTKDQPFEWKTYKTFKKMSEIDSDFTMLDAAQVVKNEGYDVIDKPLQYYLFDPVLHAATRGQTIESSDCYAYLIHHPREVYMQLLKTCRDYIYKKHKSTVSWEQYKTGGRDIWVVSAKDRLSSHMGVVYRSIYPGMLTACEKYLKRDDLNMDSYGTHELRRLYVCYSYEFFGRGITKEIAYAQYVLNHASLSSTVFYTTLHFNMYLRGGPDEQANERESMIAHIASVQGAVKTLKRKLEHVEQMAAIQKKHTNANVVSFMVDDEEVIVPRLEHAPRGSSRRFMIARGVLKGEELKDLGVKFTKRSLRRLGVNSLIVADVYNEVQSRNNVNVHVQERR